MADDSVEKDVTFSRHFRRSYKYLKLLSRAVKMKFGSNLGEGDLVLKLYSLQIRCLLFGVRYSFLEICILSARFKLSFGEYWEKMFDDFCTITSISKYLGSPKYSL